MIRLHIFCCIILLAEVTLEGTCQADLTIAKLVGTWDITVFQDDGRDRLARLAAGPGKKSDAAPRIAKLVFQADGSCFVLRGDKRRELASGLTNAGWKSFALNPEDATNGIDITGFAGKKSEKLKVYVGIVKIDGDVLTICYAEQGKARPTEFKSNGAMNLFVAKRASGEPLSLPK